MARRPPRPPGSEDSLLDTLRRYEQEGFTGQFAARPGGRLKCLSCQSEVDARSASLLALRRLEGASDPGDMMAVAALECPRCSAKGTLVAHFGADASREEALVLKALHDERGSSGIPAGL